MEAINLGSTDSRAANSMGGQPPRYNTRLMMAIDCAETFYQLAEVCQPGMSAGDLFREALSSGVAPHLSARGLHSRIFEFFWPCFMDRHPERIEHIIKMANTGTYQAARQLMLLFMCRSNAILGDFIRDVYWQRRRHGSSQLELDEARLFVREGLDQSRGAGWWAESTIERMAGSLLRLCSEFGLIEDGRGGSREILLMHPAREVVAYLACQLQFAGVGDNALLRHRDWAVFGMSEEDVREALGRLSRDGLLVMQSAGGTIRIEWQIDSIDELWSRL